MRNKTDIGTCRCGDGLSSWLSAPSGPKGKRRSRVIVSSAAEGKMEGVVVNAHRPGSIVEVSVTTDAEGRYSFPRNRLEPGEYALSIRAVGYDIDAPAKAIVATERVATADMKLKRPGISPVNLPMPSG